MGERRKAGGRRGALASQNRGQTEDNRGQSATVKRRKRRQGGKGKPFQKGQPDLPGQRFGPGNQANPGGRPKALKEVKEFIQAYGIELAQELVNIVFWKRAGIPYRESPGQKERIQAIKELFDRGYGRSVQAVEISGPGGGPVETRPIDEMTSEERGEALAELLAKAGVAAPADEDGDVGPGGP